MFVLIFIYRFVYSFNVDAGDSSDSGAAIMECFSSQTVPAISTLATSFGLCDRYHASIPGPTQPNRMYVFSATSDGAANNNDAHIAIGYNQETIFDSVYNAGMILFTFCANRIMLLT